MNVKLVQSYRFPNVWSLVGHEDTGWSRMFRDPLFENGAMSAENAVTYARGRGYRIVKIEATYSGPRDSWQEVIAGIEYRSRRPVLEGAGSAGMAAGGAPMDSGGAVGD